MEPIDLFIDTLNKCFGDHTIGIIHINSDSSGGNAWDIRKTGDHQFEFGTLLADDLVFRAKIRRFFDEGSGCILRVFTKQFHDNLPFKELYGFFLAPNHTIMQIGYLELERACNTDAATGRPLPAEKNVIYCDLDNHKLPSFEIE